MINTLGREKDLFIMLVNLLYDISMARFANVEFSDPELDDFLREFDLLRKQRLFSKDNIVILFLKSLPYFIHEEKSKYLDQ